MSRASESHRLSADAIAHALGTRRIGRRVIVLPEIDSTNSYALDEVLRSEGNSADGMAILAEYQTAGRGRLGRKWISPRGAGVHLTLLMISPHGTFSHGRMMMLSAIAVLEGIEASTDVDPTIRWPNDIYVGERKLAGILIETRPYGDAQLAIALGLGVNCLQQAGHLPAELADRATSLEIESRQAIDRTAVVRSILQAVDRLLVESPTDEALAARWREHSTDIGASVRLHDGTGEYSGRILDAHPTDGLLVHLDHGGRRHFDPSVTSRV